MKFKLVDSNDELKQILELQNDNHFENVSSDAKNGDGFVTVRHNMDLLSQMNEKAKQVVAIDKSKVVGYALVMFKEFKKLIPVLIPMFEVFEDIQYKGSKLSDFDYYVMGQVCVSEKYRGKGLCESLYKKHKEIYSSKFDLCLTEVSTNNPRSMKAHQKVGFEIIHTFRDKTDEWNVLSWDWK